MLSFLVVVCLTMPLERLFQCQNIYVYFRIQVVSRESRTMIRSSALSLHFLNQSTYSLARFLCMARRRGQNLGGVDFCEEEWTFVRRTGLLRGGVEFLRGGVEFCEEEWRVEFCEELSR